MDPEIRKVLHRKVVEHLDPRNIGLRPGGPVDLKRRASSLLEREILALRLPPPEGDALRSAVLDEIFDYGPLTPLLSDPSVTEIMVNGPSDVYVERSGRLSSAGVVFLSEETLRATIDRMISRVNRRLDESSPCVDARLPDGSRVNAVIPPLSLSGSCLTIRKFRKTPFSVDDLVALGTLSPEAAAYLRRAVETRMNVIVSGGTGSGKTTLLNALSGFIPDGERIITIEDAAEIRLAKPNVVRLEARPPNIEGAGAVTIRDLVRNSLRMRPDRIIVGECRGGEALDMLQAMNTGHDGSITTGHANTPRDMLRRLETMVLMSGVDIPVRAVREQIASAIDVVVHVGRLPDGRRAVLFITEITGMSDLQILLQDVFTRRRGTGDAGPGDLRPTGIPSKLVEGREVRWT